MSLQCDPSSFHFCFALPLYGNRQASPPPRYHFTFPSLWLTALLFAMALPLTGGGGASLHFAGPPKGRCCDTQGLWGYSYSPACPHWERRERTWEWSCHPFPWRLLVFRVGALGSLTALQGGAKTSQSKTAPRYSTDPAKLLGSTQQSMWHTHV